MADGCGGIVRHLGVGSSQRGGSPWLARFSRPGHFPDPSGAGVRVDGTRGEGTQVGDAEVVIADEVELAIVARFIAGIVALGWRAAGPRRPVLVQCLPLSSHVC